MNRRSLLVAAFAVALACLVVAPPRLSSMRVKAEASPVVVAVPPRAEPEKFALLVGVNEYMHPTGMRQLKGCENDVREMERLLSEVYGFPNAPEKDHIRTLLNKEATKDKIVSLFKSHLIENARSNKDAVIVFYFSGHGSQVKDKNKEEEPDGFDETLVPTDSRDPAGKNFDITDDELYALFRQFKSHTSNVTFILDSCHSGTATKGRAVEREIKPDERKQPEAQVKTEPDDRRIDVLPLARLGYVAISACRAKEKAYEVTFKTADGREEGIGYLTLYLVRALRTNPRATYRELMREVRDAVTLAMPEQHPEAEGDLGRPVFGGTGAVENPSVPVRAGKGKLFTVEAGIAHTLCAVAGCEGMRLSIYGPDEREFAPAKALTSATVKSVDALTSKVELDYPLDLPRGAKAVPLSPIFNAKRLRVALEKPPPTAAPPSASARNLQAALAAEIRKTNWLQLVELEPNTLAARIEATPAWDVAVMRGRFGEVFKDASALARPAQDEDGSDAQGCRRTRATEASAGDARPPRAQDEVYYLATPGGRPLYGYFFLPADPKAEQKLALSLELFARRRDLRALRKRGTLSGDIKITIIKIEAKVVEKREGDKVWDEFECTRTKADGKTCEETPLESDEVYPTLEPGTPYKIRVRNDSTQDLYVTVFDLRPDGRIDIVYPPQGANELLPARGEMTVKQRLVDDEGRELDEEEDAEFIVEGPPGEEVFKVVATTNPSDFCFLTSAGLMKSKGRPDEQSTKPPLVWLVETARQAARPPVVEVIDDWTAADVVVLIGDVGVK